MFSPFYISPFLHLCCLDHDMISGSVKGGTVKRKKRVNKKRVEAKTKRKKWQHRCVLYFEHVHIPWGPPLRWGSERRTATRTSSHPTSKPTHRMCPLNKTRKINGRAKEGGVPSRGMNRPRRHAAYPNKAFSLQVMRCISIWHALSTELTILEGKGNSNNVCCTTVLRYLVLALFFRPVGICIYRSRWVSTPIVLSSSRSGFVLGFQSFHTTINWIVTRKARCHMPLPWHSSDRSWSTADQLVPWGSAYSTDPTQEETWGKTMRICSGPTRQLELLYVDHMRLGIYLLFEANDLDYELRINSQFS